MYDEIKVLKDAEQTEIDVDVLNIKKKQGFDDYDHTEEFDKRPDHTPLKVGLLLITIGVIALLLTQNNTLWHYWWVIFFFKPFLFGFHSWGRCR